MESELLILQQFARSHEPAYLPDLEELLKNLKLQGNALNGAKVTIPVKFLKFLIRNCLVSQEFDEKSYLEANPDVRVAVSKGEVDSAWSHYIFNGYFEKRSPGTFKIDENYYRAANLDVARAERTNALKPTIHYNNNGRAEGRSASELDWKLKTLWLNATKA